MFGTFGQPYLRQHLQGRFPCLRTGLAADPQGHGHVLGSGELGQQMVKLVNKTQMAVTHVALFGQTQTRKILPQNAHAATGRHIQSAQHVQQGALARSGCTNDGDRFTGHYPQIHALQHRQVDRLALMKPLGQSLGLQHRKSILGKLPRITHNAMPPPD